MSYSELSREAGSLRKEKQFNEAIPVFEALFAGFQDDCNEFDWWGYAQCLLKLDNYDQTLEISREGLKKFPDSVYLKNTYAWAIYHIHISPEPVTDREIFFKAADAILRFTGPDDRYSPFAITIFSVIDLLELNYDVHVQEILSWISKLNPDRLDRTPFEFTTSEGKQVKIASHFEKYYAVITKALYETEDFDACIAKVDEATTAIARFHNSNEVWIPRHKALAQFRLRRYSESIAGLLALLPRKPEWYIRKEIAEAFEAMGDLPGAFKYAVEAATGSGEPSRKINLYMLLARLYDKKGRPREACLHAAYANLLRQKESWPNDADATALINRLAPNGYEIPDLRQAASGLKKIWEAYGQDIPRIEGKIKNLLSTGKAGFINGTDGKSYYFSVRDFKGENNQITVGCKVSFILVPAFDQVRQQPSVKAADVKPV